MEIEGECREMRLENTIVTEEYFLHTESEREECVFHTESEREECLECGLGLCENKIESHDE